MSDPFSNSLAITTSYLKIELTSEDKAEFQGQLLDELPGFTGHEKLKGHNLIHMNGRIYSPAYGRFISADIGVPYPDDWYSYNRYMYVGGNPASRFDPSGFTDQNVQPQQPELMPWESQQLQIQQQVDLQIPANFSLQQYMDVSLSSMNAYSPQFGASVNQMQYLSSMNTGYNQRFASSTISVGELRGFNGMFSEISGALLSKANLLLAALSLSGDSPQGVMLFRAGSLAEIQDIMSCSCFRPGPNSYEGKLFALSITDARAQLTVFQILDKKLGIADNYGIVITSVSDQYFSQLEKVYDLDSAIMTQPSVHVSLPQLPSFNVEANEHGIYWME